jgi:hypothetical protein
MITPLIFSLLAFFIVTTTTIVVIKNKSKVNHIDKTFNVTKLKLENDKYENQKKIQNLVNEVNLNNKRLENNQKINKQELQFENKKTNKQVGNLDKRFNSYKNITTANFMGINNRMTSENQRLQQDIDLNRSKTVENATKLNIVKNTINSRIDSHLVNYNDFKENTYKTDKDELKARDAENSRNLSKFKEELQNTIIDNSTLTLDARTSLSNIVNSKDDAIKSSLDNFFNTSEFVQNNSTNVGTNLLFSEWFDNYNSIPSRTNFQSFQSLLEKADEDMTTMRNEQEKIVKLQNKTTDHSLWLQSSCNLYKQDLHSFVQDNYDFDMTKLADIEGNASKIVQINSQLESLSNTLKDIAVIDVETGRSTMSLQDLNESIKNNSNNLDTINTSMVTKMNTTEFGDKLTEFIGDHYEEISTNLNTNTLVDKLENQTLQLDSVHATSLNGQELIIQGEDFTTKVNKGDAYLKDMDKFFSFNNGADFYNNRDELELERKPLVHFLDSGNPNTSTWISDDVHDSSDKVQFAYGTDLQLSRHHTNNQGGRLIIDSFDDIGIPERLTMSGTIAASSINEDTKRFTMTETLGGALSNIRNDMEAISQSVQNDGITKAALYNTINNKRLASYTSDNERQGEFKDNDEINDSFRILNLYTGIPNEPSCFIGGTQNLENKCKTVDSRLQALEANDSTDSLINSGFTMNMSTLSGDIGSASDNLTIKNPSVMINNKLSVNEMEATKLTIPNNGSLILKEENDLLVGVPGTYSGDVRPTVPLVGKLVNKSSPDYIKTIVPTPTGFTWTKGDNTSDTYSSPAAAATVTETDIKSYTKTNSSKGSMLSGDTTTYQFKSYTPTSITGADNLPNPIIVPTKYVHSIVDSGDKYTVNTTTGTLDTFSVLDIPKGANDRASILTHLNENPSQLEHVPNFENGIKFGSEGCIKMSDNKLQVCDSTCSTCHNVWDMQAAPEPTA